MLSAIEEDRIAAAVTDAEKGTTGEIVVVLASEVSRYREVPLAWAAALSLAVPPLLFAAGLRPIANLAEDLWTYGQPTTTALGLTFSLYAIAQIVLFMVVYAVAAMPAVRRRITPAALRRHRVDSAAHHQFLSLSNRASGSETGVLVFVALDDRQVRVLADAGIHQKCGEEPWRQAVAAIAAAMKAGEDPTGGILEAVRICGAALAAHYPGSGPHAFSARPLEV
jgi:putative membrane protein